MFFFFFQNIQAAYDDVSVKISEGSIKYDDQSTLDYVSRTLNENNLSVWSTTTESSTHEPPPTYESILRGLVLHVNSLKDFYVQIDNADEMLMRMNIELSSQIEKIPSIGALCLVKDTTDEQLYRAKIIGVKNSNNNMSMNSSAYLQEPKFEVIYIDFGNVVSVPMSNVYKISSDLKHMKPLALNCELNYTSKLKSWIDKLEETKQSSQSLVKCLKTLTSKSHVEVRVIKSSKNGKSLVDLFIGNDNVCDNLVLDAISLHKPIQIHSIDTSQSNKDSPTELDVYLIGLDEAQFFSSKRNLTQIKVLHATMLKLVDSSSVLTAFLAKKQYAKDDLYCLAPLPRLFKDNFALKNAYGRVFITERKNSSSESSKKLVLANFIDFDYQAWIEKSTLLKASDDLLKMTSSVENFNLNLANNADLARLTKSQLEHLNEIFKLLVSYDVHEVSGGSYKFAFSTKLRSHVCHSNNTSFSNNDNVELRSLRLVDEQRENLDINYVLEKCICLMVKCFRGHLIHLEKDFSQFDCLNKVASDVEFTKQLEKIFGWVFFWLVVYPSIKLIPNMNRTS